MQRQEGLRLAEGLRDGCAERVGFGRIWKGGGAFPRQKLGRESLPGGWGRDPEGIEASLNGQRPAASAGGWETGWEHRKPARLGWRRTPLPDHHPACFVPMPPTPLIPATQDSLCYLTSHSPKTFLSVLVSHCLLHSGNFSSLCFLANSAHPSRSSSNATSSVQPSLIAMIRMNYPALLGNPTLGRWRCGSPLSENWFGGWALFLPCTAKVTTLISSPVKRKNIAKHFE